MAVVDHQAVKDAVGRLYKAGKKFPQREMFYSVPQEERAKKAMSIMQDTIDTIAGYFVPKQIGLKLWQDAVDIALVSAEEFITPKLMQDAITEAQRRIVADNTARAEQDKRDERAFLSDVEHGERLDMTSVLLLWTKKQLAMGREICPYLPSEGQIADFVIRNKIPREVADKHRTLIRAYLNDYNFSQATGRRMGSKLFNRGERLELMLL